MTSVCDQSLQRYLGRLRARSNLSESDCEAILGLPAEQVAFAARSDIVVPGERISHALLVSKGLVGRYGQNPDGKRLFTSVYLPGEMADLHSVVEPVGVWAMEALNDTILCQIPHSAMKRLVSEHPTVALALWQDDANDWAMTAERAVVLATHSALSRLAHLLCELYERFRLAGLVVDHQFVLPLNQSQLGEMLGLSSVHISRMLTELRQRGAIQMEGRTLTIISSDKLGELAGFEPSYLRLAAALG